MLVIGGGDTGNDCVGTAIRLGAKSGVQLEMMPKPPETRTPGNPWPEWPRVLKTDYGQEEAIALFGRDPRIYQTTVTEFIKDEKGNVQKAKIISLEPKKDEKTGRMNMVPVEGTEQGDGRAAGPDRGRLSGKPEICDRCLSGRSQFPDKCVDKAG